MSAVFSQNLRRVDFQDFFRFVAVRSFTADSRLLQPTECEHHTSHVHFSQCSFHHIHASCVLWSFCLIVLSSTTPLSSPSSPSSLSSPCLSFCPSTSSSRMWWTNSLCTSANEDLGTLAEYDPLTCDNMNVAF